MVSYRKELVVDAKNTSAQELSVSGVKTGIHLPSLGVFERKRLIFVRGTPGHPSYSERAPPGGPPRARRAMHDRFRASSVGE